MFRFGQTSLDNMVGVNPELVACAKDAIKITKVDFGIPSGGGLRTTLQQREMFNNGASKIDGLMKRSYHQSGNALDVFAYVDGRANYEMSNLAMVAAAMLQSAASRGLVLEWGGLWTTEKHGIVDGPHFQVSYEII